MDVPNDAPNGASDMELKEAQASQPEKEKPSWRRSSIPPNISSDGRRIITEEECWDSLGYSWPMWKKWMLLSSIFAVQVSMNFNTSVFPSAIKQIAEYWQVSEQIARVGQMIFLVFYAFGWYVVRCKLWIAHLN